MGGGVWHLSGTGWCLVSGRSSHKPKGEMMRPRHLALALSFSFLALPALALAQQEGEDVRVTVAVDSLLRSDTHPEGFLPLAERAPPLEAGNYYCVVFTTFTRIDEIYVEGLGGRDAKTVLRDDSGALHNLRSYQLSGLEYSDLSDITSPSWVVEGGTATLFFQLPQGAEPESLLFRYFFKEALEEEAAQMGEVELKLGGVLER